MWGDGTFLGMLGGPGNVGGSPLSGSGSVAVDPASGELLVADSGHNRVLVYARDGTPLARWGSAGGNGAPGSGASGFKRPAAVAVAPNGDVYVADTLNNRVVHLGPTGAFLGEWGRRGGIDGRLRGPGGITVDAAGLVYVADTENSRIEVFDAAGHFRGKWGLRGTGLGFFSQPTAITAGCSGAIYVADTKNNRVESFDTQTPGSCAAAGSWPPPLDVAPAVTVKLQHRGRILARRAVTLVVSCRRGCKILVSGTLSPRGSRHAVRLISVARALPPGANGHVRLVVGKRALRSLRARLGTRRGLTADVTVVAAGPTGRRTVVPARYPVVR
jgi:hypothetical protein